ncbi:MAG: hypothetical protein M3040_03295 [Bacteroidota bacterium]|nr:hypothetical protein [Bacteroidota bacterium]
MKVSSLILLVTFVLLVTALFASNVLLKKEYDKVDKSDLYWTYNKILQQPFKHLVIEGGNITNIAYEQSKTSSVRVFKNWDGYEKGAVNAFVKRDTLFIKFSNVINNPNEKQWLKYITPLRIFSPELLSVNGVDTNFELFKLKQKSISVNLSGKSKLEVESYLSSLDTLNISQQDSSEVVFEMSPDLMTSGPKATEAVGAKGSASVKAETLPNPDIMLTPAAISKGWETINIQYVNANLKDISLLDIGHAQIKSLKLNITDSAAVILSGGTLKSIRK